MYGIRAQFKFKSDVFTLSCAYWWLIGRWIFNFYTAAPISWCLCGSVTYLNQNIDSSLRWDMAVRLYVYRHSYTNVKSSFLYACLCSNHSHRQYLASTDVATSDWSHVGRYSPLSLAALDDDNMTTCTSLAGSRNPLIKVPIEPYRTVRVAIAAVGSFSFDFATCEETTVLLATVEATDTCVPFCHVPKKCIYTGTSGNYDYIFYCECPQNRCAALSIYSNAKSQVANAELCLVGYIPIWQCKHTIRDVLTAIPEIYFTWYLVWTVDACPNLDYDAVRLPEQNTYYELIDMHSSPKEP